MGSFFAILPMFQILSDSWIGLQFYHNNDMFINDC